jgi:hypothetical protein
VLQRLLQSLKRGAAETQAIANEARLADDYGGIMLLQSRRRLGVLRLEALRAMC